MKIAFYINTLYGGGAERVLANLANQFCLHGHQVAVITTISDPRDFALEKNINRINLSCYGEHFINVITRNFILIRRLTSVLNKICPDVAISFMAEPNFRLLASPSHVKKIISIRSDPNFEYNGLRGAITKSLFYRISGIVCQTVDVQAWLKPSIRKKSKVIINQVNPLFYDTIQKGAEYYVATGRLNHAKNYHLMIDSFHDFRKIHPKAKLFIYGDGSLRDELSNKIIEYGDDGYIVLKGSSLNIQDILSRAKAFILSSDHEGMPNGLLEAMAVGLPCISTDCPCGGPRTVINNGENGILIPVGDRVSMLNALCKIEENCMFAKKIAHNAKISSQSFSPSIIYNEWESFIKKIINK